MTTTTTTTTGRSGGMAGRFTHVAGALVGSFEPPRRGVRCSILLVPRAEVSSLLDDDSTTTTVILDCRRGDPSRRTFGGAQRGGLDHS